MNYIIFDLEWNQSPYGKEEEIKELPFEIIDIGAVKIDEERRVVGFFHEFIKPAVYKKLHYRTREKIQVTDRDLKQGKPFPQAAKEFFEWCGDDYIFCTWGDQDTIELQRNLDYYGMGDYLPGPFFFVDVQILFALEYSKDYTRYSLSKAVEMLLDERSERTFHAAFDDAKYTAYIFTVLPVDTVENNHTLDYYRNPKSAEDEIHVRYANRIKCIYREYDAKSKAVKNPRTRQLYCPVCNNEVDIKIDWTVKSSRKYISWAQCKKHGYMKGEIRIKEVTSDDGEKKYFAVKTICLEKKRTAVKMIEEEGERRKLIKNTV